MNPMALAASCIALGFAGSALAQQPSDTVKEIEKYRDALEEGNPAELWEARGEALWKEPRGPKHASLEKCDLGLGPGVVKGAYTVLPKYFADTDRVEDLESRLVTCMVSLQGFTPEQAKKDPFGGPGKKVPMDALVAYVTSESRGMPMHVSLSNPKEKEAYEIGKAIFFHRSGPYDFGCTTCHGADHQRIRLQDLPNLLTSKGAEAAYTTWPAYRVSQGEVRTMQHRLYDCLRQQRFPEPAYGSDVITALSLFLAKNANGGTYDGPNMKR